MDELNRTPAGRVEVDHALARDLSLMQISWRTAANLLFNALERRCNQIAVDADLRRRRKFDRQALARAGANWPQ